MPFSASSRFPEIGWYLIYNMYREYTVEELLTTHIVVFFKKLTLICEKHLPQDSAQGMMVVAYR